MEVEHKSPKPDYHAKWYSENKDKLHTKMREKVMCECGNMCARNAMHRHLVSKKHRSALEIINLKKRLSNEHI